MNLSGRKELSPRVNWSRKKFALVERETGIEPASLAWEASVLPLYYSRKIYLNIFPNHLCQKGKLAAAWILALATEFSLLIKTTFSSGRLTFNFNLASFSK